MRPNLSGHIKLLTHISHLVVLLYTIFLLVPKYSFLSTWLFLHEEYIDLLLPVKRGKINSLKNVLKSFIN